MTSNLLFKEITVSDSKPSRYERQDNSENHEFQFRYFVIPATVVELVADKTISRGQAWLLGLIDSLVKTRGEGCWASNAWLAQRCGVNKRQVQYDIEHLRDLGLIIDSAKQKIVKDEPMRTIETVWSRDTERHPTPCNPLHPPVQSIASPRAMDCTQVDTDREGKAERDCPPMSSKTNGALSSIKIDGWAKATAAKLRRLVTKEMNQISPYKASDWEKEFVRLRASLDGNEHVIDETLDWFSQNWRGLKGRFFSAKSFCKNFTMFLEMSKREHLIHGSNGASSNGHNKNGNTRLCVKSTVSDEMITRLADSGVDVEDMIAEVRDMGFPKVGARGLAEAVVVSCEAIAETTRRLSAMSEDPSLDDYGILADVASKVLDRIGSDCQGATVRWFRSYLTRLKRWGDWNGSWKPFLFNEENKEFLQMVDKCCDSTRQADEFLEVFRRYNL
jgi:hypothetical protein